ncbi:General secretion pathway protein GspF [Gammaproteobacteria bacterium]
MRRPKTTNEYIDLIEQAIFELGELRAADEWEQEEGGNTLGFIDPLTAQLRQLLEQLQAGTHRFGEGDLVLINIVRVHARQIPFKSLLDLINQTHRLGLENGTPT